MIKTRACSSLVAMLLFVYAAPALQEKSKSVEDTANSGLIYGTDHSFTLTAPTGWVLDNSSGVSQGLHAVFYRRGSSWKDAVAVMYARAVHKNSEKKTLEDVVQADVADFKKSSKDSTATDGSPLPTRDKKTALVRFFYDGANKNYEAVAFIDEPKVVVLLALTSRTKDDYENSLAAFKELVGSYYFISDKVNQ
jgi:hypothetical protein